MKIKFNDEDVDINSFRYMYLDIERSTVPVGSRPFIIKRYMNKTFTSAAISWAPDSKSALSNIFGSYSRNLRIEGEWEVFYANGEEFWVKECTT